MLDDLDRTLRELLLQDMPRVAERIPQGGFDVKFDLPNREFKSQVAVPTICLYLYHIQENLEAGRGTWSLNRENGAGTTTRPPVRLDCSYLVTTWSLGSVEDEHRLLAATARVFFRNPVVPVDMVQGGLTGRIEIKTEAVQPQTFKDVVDIWSVLDNDLRPSMQVTVQVPLDVDVERTVPLVTGPARFDLGPAPRAAGLVDVSGILTTRRSPVPGATIRMHQASTVTDEEGRFAFSQVPLGLCRVFVEAEGRLRVFYADVQSPELRLSLPVTVHGTLTREAAPIAGALVTVGASSGETDEQGEFTLEDVPPARETRAWVEVRDGAQKPISYQRVVTIDDAADTAEVRLELADVRAAGIVRRTGVGVPGARIMVHRAVGFTGRDGRFVLDAVSPGPGVLRVTERNGRQHEFDADMSAEVVIDLP